MQVNSKIVCLPIRESGCLAQKSLILSIHGKFPVCSTGYKRHRFCLLVSCLTYSSTLKMEEICFSETSVDFQRTTRRYIPEDRIFLDLIPSSNQEYCGVFRVTGTPFGLLVGFISRLVIHSFNYTQIHSQYSTIADLNTFHSPLHTH
jgi:hypothetical protein